MAITLKGPQRARLRHFAKYALVSVVATVTSLTTLGLLVGLCDWSSVGANVLATAIGTIPSFELNRRWVWAQRGQKPRLAQILPFSVLSLAGLLFSTIAVHLAGDATISSGRLAHTAAVEGANCGTYGTLWIIQFFLCDKVLFKRSGPTTPHVDVALVSAGASANNSGSSRRALHPAHPAHR
jgi:putative flippase GtrA